MFAKEVQHQLCQLELLNGFQSNPKHPWGGEASGLLRADFMVVQTTNPSDQRWSELPRCSRSWSSLHREGLQQKPVRSRHLVRGFWQAGSCLRRGSMVITKHHKESYFKIFQINRNGLNPGREMPGPVRECLDSILNDISLGWRSLLGANLLTNNNSVWIPPRSFKVIYATAVRSDGSYIVNTNRGHPAEIRCNKICNMMQHVLANCSMNMFLANFEQHLSNVYW